MAKSLSGIRQALKSEVHSEHHARTLAREAAAIIAPETAEIAARLEEAFVSIAIADKLRGESVVARAGALEMLDNADKSAKAKK